MNSDVITEFFIKAEPIDYIKFKNGSEFAADDVIERIKNTAFYMRQCYFYPDRTELDGPLLELFKEKCMDSIHTIKKEKNRILVEWNDDRTSIMNLVKDIMVSCNEASINFYHSTEEIKSQKIDKVAAENYLSSNHINGIIMKLFTDGFVYQDITLNQNIFVNWEDLALDNLYCR